MNFKINTSIPGQVSRKELERIAELAGAVPAGGVIVEVGSLYGLSSWHLSQNCRNDVAVFCIDPWQREDWIRTLVEGPHNAPPFGHEAFLEFTKDCTNIVSIKGFSPAIVEGWSKPIDLLFEDADHSNPGFKRSLEFWLPKLKTGGTLAGHDFVPQSPDVIAEVCWLQRELDTPLTIVDSIWSMQIPLAKPKNFRTQG